MSLLGRPVKRGGRFSRNDVTPSWASAERPVCHMPSESIRWASRGCSAPSMRHSIWRMRATETAEVFCALGRPRPARERLAAAAEVGPRAECAAGAGHDHRPHVVVAVGAVEGLHQLADEGGVDGVEPVGAVEGDGRHAVGDVVEQRLEGHAQNPSARTSLPAVAGSGAAGATAASFFTSGMTSLTNSRMLRSASSYGMPAYENTPTKWLLPVRRWMSTMRS